LAGQHYRGKIASQPTSFSKVGVVDKTLGVLLEVDDLLYAMSLHIPPLFQVLTVL
jgi:hypothetical protein